MIKLNTASITHSYSLNSCLLNDIKSSLTTDECTADISGAQGEIYLLVDATKSTGTISLTLLGGENPATASADTDYTLAGGSCNVIVVSSGERSYKDGTLHFKLKSASSLNTQALRIAVIKRCNVESH